jgi:acetoin utilization protein AcuB
MSSDVVSVDPETELTEVVDIMLEYKIGALPVVEADSAELVGIISYIDALRAARPLL